MSIAAALLVSGAAVSTLLMAVLDATLLPLIYYLFRHKWLERELLVERIATRSPLLAEWLDCAICQSVWYGMAVACFWYSRWGLLCIPLGLGSAAVGVLIRAVILKAQEE